MEDELTSEWTPPPPGDLPELAPETLAAVRALQEGEVEESTRLIFETFEPQLVAYFRRHGCDDFEADDLAQTVLLKMLDQIGTLKEATSFHFWLFKIARHSLYNFVRDKGRSRDGFEDLAGKARKDSESSAFWVRGTFEPSPDAKLTVSETVDRRRHLLRKLLEVSRLAPRTVQSLVRRLHGESYEEIGRALEIPVGTARSHVSRASAALIRNLDWIDADDVALEDGVNDAGDDVVAQMSSELLTFKREAQEADPAYFRAGMLEAGSADYDRAEESDEEADGDEEDYEEEDELELVFDSSAEIDAVVREDRARGRSRRRVTRTIERAGHRAQELALEPLEKEDLGFPRILLEEAAVFAAELGSNGADLALKAKLTCAGSLLARGRRFKTAREVQELVRQAIVLIGNGRRDGYGDEIRHKVSEGCTLLRSFLGWEKADFAGQIPALTETQGKEMETMNAKMTNVSTEAAVRLKTLIESHAHDAGRQLGDWLRPYLRDGEELPDFSLALQLPARMIEQAGHLLRESQNELDESRSRESEARAWREEKASALRRKLVEIRQLVTPVFGSRTAMVLGIEGKTARASQSALLSSQADSILKVLRDPKRLAKPDTVYFDPAPAAATLEPLIVASREAGGYLDEVCQASAARLEARDRARTELHRGIHWVVRMLSGWLGLVRRADLAEKLRRLQRPDQVRKTRNAKKVKNQREQPSRKEVPM